jgi:long-chain acyl-CoA synthetase
MVYRWQPIYDRLGITEPDFLDKTLGEWIAHHATERPDAPALQYFTRTFSFAQYDQLVNQLAQGLTTLGVKPGDVVGLHMPNIPQYPIALAALSRIGAIGSGVSPLLAPPEIAHQVKDAGISVLLSLSDLAPALTAIPSVPGNLRHIVMCGARDMLDAPALTLPDISGATAHSFLDILSNDDTPVPQHPVAPDDIFMIQYTGGTTGRPKGAQLSHRTLLHNPIQVAQGDPAAVPGAEIYASAFPLFHVAGLSFAIGTAIYGAHNFLIPNPRDIDNFIDLMTAFPPTRMAAVPALYDMMLAHPRIKDVDFSKLKVAKTGAAPMTEATRARFDKVIGPNLLADVFGMTETGPCYTFHPLEAFRRGSVGLPVPSCEVRIMDVETGTQEMPAGEPGEICSSGPQTMRGYLNLPDESAHALRERDGKRWMHSGDVGYMDEDGYIFLCDRAKDMLVVGGFKVFSVEVEDKLKALPMITESAVIGTPDTARPGNDIVNLYVQLSEEHAAQDPDTLRTQILDFMRTNMAPYKVPRHIHFIDAIPLTPVGKIDKKALRMSGQT